MIDWYGLPLVVKIDIAVFSAVRDGVDRHLGRLRLSRRLLRRASGGIEAVAQQHDGAGGNRVRVVRIFGRLLQSPKRCRDSLPDRSRVLKLNAVDRILNGVM